MEILYADLSTEKLPLKHLNSFTKEGVLIMVFKQDDKKIIDMKGQEFYNVNGVDFVGAYVPTKTWEKALLWLSNVS